MIRTGYLRWEIEAADARSSADASAREVSLRARPSYRMVRLKDVVPQAAAERFVNGEAGYDDVLRARNRPATEVEHSEPHIGRRSTGAAPTAQTPRWYTIP